MSLELPSFPTALEDLRGVSPNVHLDYEPWGHMDHEDEHCCCQSSDRTSAYVHDLTIDGRELVHSPDAGVASSCSTRTNGHLCIDPSWGRAGFPDLVRGSADVS